MKIDAALKIRGVLVRDYRDLFSRAEHFGMPHKAMLDARAGLWDKLPPGVPQWVHHYASGIWDQLQYDAYAHDLVYGGMIGGTFYSTHRGRADYYEKHGIEPRDYSDNGRVQACGHYWSRTLKPFSVEA